MTDVLLELSKFFIDKNCAIGDGVDVFRDFEPDSPDKAIIINEYSGTSTPKGSQVSSRYVQVLSRDMSKANAKAKAIELYEIIDTEDTHYMLLSEGKWCLAIKKQTPFKVKVDSAGRTYYGFNLNIILNEI